MDRSRPRGLVIMDKSRYPGHNFYYFRREDKKVLEIMDRSRPRGLTGLVIMDKSRYPGHNFDYFLREDKKVLEIMDRSRPRGLVIMDRLVSHVTLHVYNSQVRKYHYASLWKLKGRSTNLQKIKIVS